MNHIELTKTEWSVLECLWEESPKSVMQIVKDMQARAGWAKSTSTTMVKRMTEKGLIVYEEHGRTKTFRAAVSREEIGNPIYPPAQRELTKHGIVGASHRARQITSADLQEFDRIYYMDGSNARYLRRLFGADADKCCPLLSRDVADPWYSGKFDVAYRDIYDGCVALLEILKQMNLNVTQAAAIGDEVNDLTMLKCIPYGFVMSSARDEIKKEVRLENITDPNKINDIIIDKYMRIGTAQSSMTPNTWYFVHNSRMPNQTAVDFSEPGEEIKAVGGFVEDNDPGNYVLMSATSFVSNSRNALAENKAKRCSVWFLHISKVITWLGILKAMLLFQN